MYYRLKHLIPIIQNRLLFRARERLKCYIMLFKAFANICEGFFMNETDETIHPKSMSFDLYKSYRFIEYHNQLSYMSNQLLILSIFLFLVSLSMKAFCTSLICFHSLKVLISGSFCVFIGGTSLIWMANPLLWASWLFNKHSTLSLSLSILAFIVALSFLFFDKIITNEGGIPEKITQFKAGYWFWLLSITMNVVAHILPFLKKT